ncbi:uncharacterized protein LOC143186278 [Calliopsis andreniformis]|uniref:uncharacterized protein LOC143186278 n=1 Tax=Calliopsis andreniformis TaxID=337506 RepID=UPI003FCE9834
MSLKFAVSSKNMTPWRTFNRENWRRSRYYLYAGTTYVGGLMNPERTQPGRFYTLQTGFSARGQGLNDAFWMSGIKTHETGIKGACGHRKKRVESQRGASSKGMGMVALSSHLKYDCNADIKHVMGPEGFTAY